MANVTIGCKLPHGLVIYRPKSRESVTLNGANKATIIGSGYGSTEVDADFWTAWKAANKDFPALANGAIFEAKTAGGIAAAAKEVEGEKSGFEQMPQEAQGVKKRSDKE